MIVKGHANCDETVVGIAYRISYSWNQSGTCSSARFCKLKLSYTELLANNKGQYIVAKLCYGKGQAHTVTNKKEFVIYCNALSSKAPLPRIIVKSHI